MSKSLVKRLASIGLLLGLGAVVGGAGVYFSDYEKSIPIIINRISVPETGKTKSPRNKPDYNLDNNRSLTIEDLEMVGDGEYTGVVAETRYYLRISPEEDKIHLSEIKALKYN